MAVHFHETRETIDLLRRLVDNLNDSNGCISAEDLWDGIQCVPAIVRSSDPTVARHGMRQMDVLRSFMSTLASTYNAYTSTTRCRAQIPQLTINGLPNELVHHIVKDALDCTEPNWLVRYSHVSSKIRNVILDSPSLWASIHLTLDMPTSLIKTIISRSAALKFTVLMHENLFQPLNFFVPKLSILFEHQHRWREATFTVSVESAKLIQKHFPRANLASVRVLRMNNMKINFIKNWDIPRLEKLDWSSYDSLLPPSDMATHTCLLSLGAVRYQDEMSVAAFLNNATGLRTLKLRLLNQSEEPRELPEIRLSCLEHLEVSVDGWTIRSAARLLKAMLCPATKRFHLQVPTFADYAAMTEDMRGRYPLLTFFQLSLSGRGVELVFDELLFSLPSTIQKFQLGGSMNMKFDASRTDGSTPNNFCASFPNLKDLDISECYVGEENLYANLSNTLKRSHVTLNHFRPCRESWTGEEAARKTLRRAGVLVDL